MNVTEHLEVLRRRRDHLRKRIGELLKSGNPPTSLAFDRAEESSLTWAIKQLEDCDARLKRKVLQ